ncbi:MAG: ATP-binding protein [Pseudohongiellaceae bacterium]
MAMVKIIKRLWNGGLNPAIADPIRLAERRTLALVSFILVPSSLLLVVSHFIVLDTNHHRAAIISATMFAGVFSVVVQAYKNWQRVASITLIAALWIAPVSLMLEEGFSSTNWAWTLPVILLANFILSRLASILFTLFSVAVLIVVYRWSMVGIIGYDISAEEHAITVAIAGSLILVLACLLGYFYRSSQIKSQQKLKNSMTILAGEVDTRRTAELKALAGERAKATFLTTMSHELRTPLNGVLGASDLLANQNVTDDVQELVKIINESGNKLLCVINDVLDISKLDEGKLDLKKEPTNLKLLVESLAATLKNQSVKKGLDFQLEIADSVSKDYMIDPARIKQLLLNLAGNAIKFTHEGKVAVTIDEFDGRVRMSVSDTGIGIEQDKLEEIFHPFAQIDSSLERQYEGGGLGLSIVDRLVKLLGGEIDVESEANSGSCFTVYIPLKEAPVAALVHSPIDSLTENNEDIDPANILVTDDNPVNREVASHLLRKLGHTVEEAGDGLEAVTIVERGGIDVVLMDVQMPNMDGLAATDKIRLLGSPSRDVPIIGLTANEFEDPESQMQESGMDYFLTKPVSLEQLRKALFTVSKAH